MDLVLIAGAQRSGTTLTQTLLANCLPKAPILSEAHLLCDILRAHDRAVRDWSKTKHFYATREELRAFTAAVAERYLADLRKRYGADATLVLKDPSFARVPGTIAEVLPEAKFLFCVRDPRDVVASLLKIGQRELAAGNEIDRYAKRDVQSMCNKILKSYRAIDEEALPRATAVVHYEALVRTPEAEITRIGQELDLPVDPENLGKPKWLEADSRHKKTWTSELEGGGASTKSVGSFRSIMSSGELFRVQLLCGKIMARFGYHKDELALGLGERIRIALAAFPFRRRARAGMRALLAHFSADPRK